MREPREPFEALIDRARREALSAPERRRLEMVLRSNEDAELEWWLLSDFTYEQAGQHGDQERLDEILRGAYARLGMDPEPEIAQADARSGRGRHSDPPPPPVPPTSEHRHGSGRTNPLTSMRLALVNMRPRWRSRAGIVGVAMGLLLGGTGLAAAASMAAEPAPKPAGVRVPKAIAPETPEAEKQRVPRASVLLARAERLRGDGNLDRAAQLYHRLIHHHSRSREAAIGRIALGELELERKNPEAALTHFDAYLRWQPEGILLPEAAVGQAKALGALGRHAEARAAWSRVASDHEGTPLAALAAQHLDPGRITR